MVVRSEKSIELYNMMLRKGYPKAFCEEITMHLNTDWTAKRMMGYLYCSKRITMEDIVDEMLAILSDRERIINKKILEYSNSHRNSYFDED